MTAARIPYRAAVVGCGRIGFRFEEDPRQWPPATHAGAFGAHPRVALAALVDPDPVQLEHACRAFPAAAGFADCAAMLEVVRPTIVCVATPPESHPSLVEACAGVGVRAIVCEKPIAPDVAAARRMIEACARADSLLFVNHTRRFDPEIRRARDEVAAGAIGEIVQATGYYTAGVRNTGTHLLDLLRFFLGEPAWVLGLRHPAWAPPDDQGIDGFVEFVSGARAVLQYSDKNDYSVFDLHLRGRRGVLSLTRFGFEIERTGLRPREDVSELLELDPETRVRDGKPRSFMQAMANHVVDCLDGLDRPLSRGEDGLAALELIEALQRSAAAGGRAVALARPPGGGSTP